MAPRKNIKRKEKQANLLLMLGFTKNVPVVEIMGESISNHSSNLQFQEHDHESANEMTRVHKAKLTFQENWPSKYKWLQEDLETGLLWCTFCTKDPHCKSLFGTIGAKNFKTSALEEHAKCVAHRNVVLLEERDKNGPKEYALRKQVSADLAFE